MLFTPESQIAAIVILGILAAAIVIIFVSNTFKDVSKAALLSVIFLLTTIFSIAWLISPGLQVAPKPEIILPLMVISGVAGLLASLCIGAVIFSILKLSDNSQALGLPKGSVRAIIALSLIIIYSIMSIFLFNEISGTTPPNEDAVKFGQQTLTTVSTLVVAVSGFYFGTRSVEAAQRAVETPGLSITPASPIELDKKAGAKSPSIKIKTTPKGEAVEWDVKPEEPGSLLQVKPYEFEYTRQKEATDTVKLIFTLVNYQDVSEVLEIKIK